MKFLKIIFLFLVMSTLSSCTTEPKQKSAPSPAKAASTPKEPAPKENVQHISADLNRMSSISQNEIKATDISFDPKTGEIKYTLPEPALVRLRIGIKNGGPMLLTLLDWEPRERGSHVEVWDKKDSSGQVLIGDRTDLLLVLACLPAGQAGIPQSAKGQGENNSSILGFQKSPDFTMGFPLASKNESGQNILSGTSPIRVSVSESDKKRLTESKYEIMLFIDYVFLYEDEDGVSPFTYMFNTAGINQGEHILTINLISYTGEMATKSVKVFIKK